MSISHHNENQLVIMEIQEDPGMENRWMIVEYLAKLLNDQTGFKAVLVDFTNIPFVDSRFLSMVVVMYKRLKEKNIRLGICNVNDEVIQVFHFSRLESLITIEKEKKLALQSLLHCINK